MTAPGPRAFDVLGRDGDRRLEPEEIRQKIEMLERLLRRSEQRPVGPPARP
ncbi:MAG: hypothetical protein HY718_01685 [Planctomycetes bacterium]|nr:hypothetical protein [Planctomycetota bacterium]